MGTSMAAVAVETDSAWSPRRLGCPVVVVVESVVVVVGSVLVVVGLVVVVVDSALVVVSSVVVGSTVVGGAVTVGCVVVAPNVRGPAVVMRPTGAGAPLVAGRVVVVGLLAASGVVSGLVVDGAREVLGWRGRVVVFDAAVGAGSAGNVGNAPGWLGVGGAGSWGTRAAEATKAARTEVVSPKANSVSRQGCRGGSRCRGDRLGIDAVVPVRLSFHCGAARQARAVPPTGTWPRTLDPTGRSCQSRRQGGRSRAAAEAILPAVARPGTAEQPATDDGGAGQGQPQRHQTAAPLGGIIQRRPAYLRAFPKQSASAPSAPLTSTTTSLPSQAGKDWRT
jgi:hypothetical protein